ncbi:MAG TPA: NAD-dependent epimerase/dehydratase family protein, partial [Gemmatimonadales bacterium]|nr:NAD-dependent epimerase/dehydratase family protein [Gemmatimonadales bacterium]
DLFDREKLAQLPKAPNVVYLVGQKFGTSGDAVRTWAVNAFLPGIVAERFAGARIVAFSTGNVYPLSPVEGDGSSETDPVGPVGEYAQSALARERVFEFFSRRHSTPMALLRLNYAIEPRYGVLRDLADRVWSQQSVDVTMGKVNLIWQRDANAIALRALTHCAVPPLVLNVTGRPAYPVRWLAQQLGKRWSRDVQFRGIEAATALLSDAARMEALFGKPETNIEAMLEQVAQWVERRGRSLGKPTHFEEREGRF